MKLYGLTEREVGILKALIAKVRDIPTTPRQRFYAEENQDVLPFHNYLARTPGAGIPALSEGAITGTGDEAPLDDVPGEATCDIYQYIYVDEVRRLVKVEKNVSVVNVTTTPIPGNSWIVVVKDVWGTFFVTGNSSSITVDEVYSLTVENNFGGYTQSDVIKIVANYHSGIYASGSTPGEVTLNLGYANLVSNGVLAPLLDPQMIGGVKRFWNFIEIPYATGGDSQAGRRGIIIINPPSPSDDSARTEVDGWIGGGGSGRVYIQAFDPTTTANFSTGAEGMTSVGIKLDSVDPEDRAIIFFATDYIYVGTHPGSNNSRPELKIYDDSGTLQTGYTGGGYVSGLLVSGTGIIPVSGGGTGLGSTPSNGQLLIGNGTGFTLATLTAGNGISITNGSGSITIATATQMSITADGSGLKLSGDSATPGNNYFYGTDGSGTKGWYSTTSFGYSQEQIEDIVDNLLIAGAGIVLSYDDPANSLEIAVTFDSASSILDAGGGIKLYGDVASPGNSYYYGTDGTGLKGWFSLPSGSYTDEQAQDAIGTNLVDSNTIDFTYDDAMGQITADAKTQMSITSDSSGLKLVSDASTPGNNKYYGTDGTGTKGWNALPSGYLNYVTAPTYSDDAGSVGEYSLDATYVYMYLNGSWKRWAFDAGFNPAPP